MKSFLILILVAGLAGALFFTRPTSDDFKMFVQAHPEMVQGQAPKGAPVLDQLTHQMKSFSAGGEVSFDPLANFLSQCTFDNRYYMWTNVSRNGHVIYTGALGHWFKQSDAAAPVPAAP